MTLERFVERVVASGVLSLSMVELRAPATPQDLAGTESRLNAPLPQSLRAVLKCWNGANLDVVRLVSCDKLETQEWGLYFANDSAGFMYFLDSMERVVVLDTDGAGVKVVASSLDDFLTGYVFGCRSDQFMGSEWLTELRAAGLAT